MKSKNNSDKPKEILHLEKNYGIKLRELKDGEDIFDNANRNTYKLDEANAIIGLNLYDNGIKDISALGTLTDLTTLELRRNQLTDISTLGSLNDLIELELSDNQITYINALNSLNSLTRLCLNKNQLTDISILGSLTGLTELELDHNMITDISILGSLTGLTKLYLSDNQLSDIRFLGSLTGLKTLSLIKNQLTDISSLGSLKSLTTLYLSNNQLTDISSLGLLTDLTVLYLGSNQLSDISSLGSLTSLTKLYLSFNQLTDISALSSLTGLTVLYLYGNQLTDISSLSSLSSLTILFLSDNQLTDISSLGLLTGLTMLKISNNQLTDISSLSSLSILRELKLDSNQLTDISSLGSLTGLTTLYLSNNQLTDISSLSSLYSLRKLELDYNQLTDINSLSFVGILKELNYLTISNNPFSISYKLPPQNHLDFILNELKRLKEDKIEVSLPVKVLLLGNHASGKSTFLNTLLPESQKVKTGSTHVLNILSYKRNEKTKLPLALFYDFGGQDYYHGIYRAFLTNKSMHLLFWHQETDCIKKQVKDSNDLPNWHYDRDYWIAQICNKQQPKPIENKDKQVIVKEQNNPSIILVQTRADLDKEKQETFHSISYEVQKEFFVSLMPQDDNSYQTHALKCLSAYIEEEIYRQSEVSEEPYWYPEFLNFIIQKKTIAPISLEDIKPHYKRELDSEELERFLKDDLDRLSRSGLILYYKDNEKLNDVAWLSPAKTVKYVHEKILNREIINEKEGKLSNEDFNSLGLNAKLKQLLLEEKILFYDEEGEKEYIIPNYLPLVNTNNAIYKLLTHGLQSPNFVLKFRDFIPFGYINRLICTFGKNKDNKYYWRNEFIFTYKECKVWIKLIFVDLEIHVCVVPPSNDTTQLMQIEQELFYLLVNLYKGNDSLVNAYIENKESSRYFLLEKSQKVKENPNSKNQNISFSPWEGSLDSLKNVAVSDVYLSKDNMFFIDLNELNNANSSLSTYVPFKRTRDLKENEMLYDIHKNTKERLIRHYKSLIELNAYIPFIKNENIKSTKKIFISYSKDDESYTNELKRHLKSLKDNVLISDFTDHDIKLGDRWHEKIQNEIENCDFFIALISPSFVKTTYIQEHELPKAIRLKKIIIPILVQSVNWAGFKEADYNSALKAHPISLNRMQYKQGIILKSQPEERNAYWVEFINKFKKDYFPD